MLTGNKTEPLLKCTIRHALEGRLRVRCRALLYLSEHRDEIVLRLRQIAGITEVSLSCLTANLLIHYIPQSVTREELLEAVESALSVYSFYAHRAEMEKKSTLAVAERDVSTESIPAMKKWLGATTLVMLVSIIRRGRPLFLLPGMGRFATFETLAVLGLSWPTIKSGTESLRLSLRPNADTLSAAAIITSALSGQTFSALAVLFLNQVAEMITALTMKRTKSAIREMLTSDTNYLWRVAPDGSLEKIAVDTARKDDLIAVHTGEKIGVDGMVVRGTGLVDQAAITGEYIPAVKKKNDTVFAGTTVKDGNLTVRATKVGAETAVTNIIRMVESATENKAPVQNYADRFSSSLLLLNMSLFGMVYSVTRNISRALSMLVIDYSCGIRLSTAAALSAAINTAARNNVFIKGSSYIESLSEVDTLVLDKTGTVTKGKPEVVSIKTINGRIEPKDIIRHAAAAEEISSHPLAKAILSRARTNGWSIPRHGEIIIVTGKGVETKVGRSIVRVGSKKFMNENSLHTHPFRHETARMAMAGENIVYVSRGRKVIGVIGISDPLRDRMKKSLNRLRMDGIDDIVLLTGDLEQHAEIVAKRMSMDRFESEQMPEDKARAVVEIQAEGSRVVMVGDGINDAAALAYADVGIALGQTRTDIAMEAADITIAGDNPMMIPAVVRLSKKTMKIIQQNFATTIGINTVALALSSVGILPVFWGAVLHNISTIMVVGNSLRLLKHPM